MMSKHPVELEIRGEVRERDIPDLERRILALGFKHHSTTRRTSVMSFGETSAAGRGWKMTKKKEVVDIRCRITNGEAEVVIKVGQTDAANRIEIAQAVTLDELITFARMFGATGLFTKVGSKRNTNYRKGPITISISQSPSGLAYIELEKMTDREHEAKDLQTLQLLAKKLAIHIWTSRKQFLDFCSLLTKRDDWEFKGTAEDIKRLKAEIKKTGADRQ